ncbi:MAG: GNAT family N-acetyltransferase [Burkholderiales bacterium]|nr:GNAT family N-acetyltransferase [Burkholderiales bacterium]
MTTSPKPPDDAPTEPRGGHSYPWIPIRSLLEADRPAVLMHLLALDERDRYLRFGHLATDEQVQHYVEGIDFARDEVFGVFNRRLELVAMAHLAYESAPRGAEACAEFGVSVASHLRGRKLGERLFAHAELHARNRGVHTLVVHALSENAPMLRIARQAGATVERHGAESQALVRLPPDNLASHVEALVGEGAAGLDYRIKREVRRVDRLLASIVGH